MSEYLNQDYSKFYKEIGRSSRSPFKIAGDIEINFRKHHKSLYAIALISSKLNTVVKEENKLIFIVEIISDLLTVTKLAVLGFENPSLIILRRAIENFYNHIYYTDHSIEYEFLNLGKNEYTPIDKLKNYFDNHPNFVGSEDPLLKEYNQLLFNEYQKLCKIVHSKGKESMNLAKCLKELVEDFEINELLETLIDIELFLFYLLYKFHRDLKFTATEKGIITSLVPANKRAHLNE